MSAVWEHIAVAGKRGGEATYNVWKADALGVMPIYTLTKIGEPAPRPSAGGYFNIEAAVRVRGLELLETVT